MPLWQRRKRAFSISRHGQLCLALPWSYEGLAAKFSQQTPAAMKREPRPSKVVDVIQA